MIPSWLIGLSYLLASLRVLPFFLFLIKYRGKLFDPVPLMLRGFAFTGFLQAATSFIILIQNSGLSALRLTGSVLWISVGNQVLTKLVSWYLFYVVVGFPRVRGSRCGGR